MKIINIKEITKTLAIIYITFFTFTACEKEEHDDHEHEEELITTVNYILTNDDEKVTLTFSDPDGEGGNDGTYSISGGDLKANTTYTGVIELLNESESLAENITEEVKAEDDEHEFFYTTNIAGLTIKKTDVDRNENPLGIETSFKTGNEGAGTVTIILKHEPTKPNDDTVASAGGSTDLEVTFNVQIKTKA